MTDDDLDGEDLRLMRIAATRHARIRFVMDIDGVDEAEATRIVEQEDAAVLAMPCDSEPSGDFGESRTPAADDMLAKAVREGAQDDAWGRIGKKFGKG